MSAAKALAFLALAIALLFVAIRAGPSTVTSVSIPPRPTDGTETFGGSPALVTGALIGAVAALAASAWTIRRRREDVS